MKIAKKDNQHYSKYFEQAINSIINNEEIINNTEKKFTIAEMKEMNNDAQLLVDFLNVKNSVYIGDKTSKENGDLLLDGKVTEIKYVSNDSKGTYYNTSVKYFENIGLPSFHDYLRDMGYLDFLLNLFPDMVKVDNSSPVTQAQSSIIRNQFKDVYEKEIKPREAAIRTKYVKDLYDIIKDSKAIQTEIARHMISKETSGKEAPERLIAFEHESKKIFSVDRAELLEYGKTNTFELAKNYSFVFDHFRMTIAWQNGTGLNNPTIRVYLK